MQEKVSQETGNSEGSQYAWVKEFNKNYAKIPEIVCRAEANHGQRSTTLHALKGLVRGKLLSS